MATKNIAVVDRNAVVDDVLDVWSARLGPALVPYRGHVYRVFNLARRLLGSERRNDVLAVVSAFHDLGIWSDATLDYLAPSIARANDYIWDRMPEVPVALVDDAIENQHRLRRVHGGDDPDMVDAFRRADLVDISRGWFRAGVESSYLRELVVRFPYAGFHALLVRTAAAWFARHPLRPLPMVKVFRSRLSVPGDPDVSDTAGP